MEEEEILVFPGIKENNNALMFYKLCILLVNSLAYFAYKIHMILIEKMKYPHIINLSLIIKNN